jgi:hypothetical protein
MHTASGAVKCVYLVICPKIVVGSHSLDLTPHTTRHFHALRLTALLNTPNSPTAFCTHNAQSRWMMVRTFHKFWYHLINSRIKYRERRLHGYMCKGLMHSWIMIRSCARSLTLFQVQMAFFDSPQFLVFDMSRAFGM